MKARVKITRVFCPKSPQLVDCNRCKACEVVGRKNIIAELTSFELCNFIVGAGGRRLDVDNHRILNVDEVVQP
jgi:hypothetical protein